jgi:hypothetical protein
MVGTAAPGAGGGADGRRRVVGPELPPRAPARPELAGGGDPGTGGKARSNGRTDGAGYGQGPRYTRSGSPGTTASPSGDPLLAINFPPLPGNPLAVLLSVLAGLLLIGLVSADGLGLGPRHREWRRRWVRFPPWT